MERDSNEVLRPKRGMTHDWPASEIEFTDAKGEVPCFLSVH